MKASLFVPLSALDSSTDAAASVAVSQMGGASASIAFYDDWGSGACGEGVVTNLGSSSTVWAVNVELQGSVTDSWNSEISYSMLPHCVGRKKSHFWHIVGAPWNRTLEPGDSTTFGFCIDRTDESDVQPSGDSVMPELLPSPIGESESAPINDPTTPMPESHDHPLVEGDFVDLATLGLSQGSDHTGHDGLVGGRTAITTEALLAYNDLRRFVGLASASLDEVGAWAFTNTLTNNTQAWGNDQRGVGLWYAMQGAKVGWMADDTFDPQVVADIERTARLGSAGDVMRMVVDYGHEGFAGYLTENGFDEAFINTLKMEPHYAGWMHDRAHGWLSIEDVAIAHDVNHLTVLSHDQMRPFMNDTWDWPQWPALDVSHARVLEYFQSMVVLGDPRGDHLHDLGAPPIPETPVTPPEDANPYEPPVETPEEPPGDESSDPVTPPMEDHEEHDHGDPTPTQSASLEIVAATTGVHVLVDSATGLAYVHDQGGEPILITRYDNYWFGNVPLTRGDATMMAAARDDLGRLRVLDGGGVDVYAWILDESGLFIGEESSSDSSIAENEALFQIDIDGDGEFGQIGGRPSPANPVMPPTEDDEDHEGGSHDHMAPPVSSGNYIDITTWETFHGSNHNSEHDELVGGRTAITTEAHQAYNNLRAFLGLSDVRLDEVGEWAFANALTNNSQAWGNDLQGVGLWYAMQGAKVAWITDEAYDPQILADIQRTARTVIDHSEMKTRVMAMVRQYGHTGYADYLEQYDLEDTFISTLKMEPHYGGWMHGRTHGFRSIEGVAINHDINHLTVLSWDQMQPFMNDTFDWPQWDALDVSDSGVIEYFQSMVSLGDPVGQNLEMAGWPTMPPGSDSTGPPEDIDPKTPPPASQPEPTYDEEVPSLPPPQASPISIEVGGELWWNGFTAELIVRNETNTDLNSWSFRFTSSHRIQGNPWGAALETKDLGTGFYEHRLTGIDWAQSIPANGSVRFGFNASQGEAIGNSGPLDADQLFDGVFLGD